MGDKKRQSRFNKAFGIDENGFANIPKKLSNVKIARLLHFDDVGGCPYCFPHGVDTFNCTRYKYQRSWKKHRNTQCRLRYE